MLTAIPSWIVVLVFESLWDLLMSTILHCFYLIECMHVTSEEGDFSFSKTSHHHLMDVAASAALRPHRSSSGHDEIANSHETDDTTPSMAVCGLYVVTDPDKFVEITIKYLNVNCESGGLMAVRYYQLFILWLDYKISRMALKYSLWTAGSWMANTFQAFKTTI